MPKPPPQYADQGFPKAEGARTFAQIMDSLKAPVREIEEKLGMTYRTYLKRRIKPTDLTLAEIIRLADWINEDSTELARELMSHTPQDAEVLSPPRQRHPKGIMRVGKSKDDNAALDTP